MKPLVGREYCIRHPRQIIQLFGLNLFLSVLLGRKGLLEHAVDHYSAHGFPLPGDVGRAYKIAALIEFRVARLYQKLAQLHADRPPAAAFFQTLQKEEEEHGRLMLLCRYVVSLRRELPFVPNLRDPQIRQLLSRLRSLRREVDGLSFEQALTLTEELEKGEINVIFGKMLGQTGQAQSRLFEDEMAHIEGHAKSVPLRVKALRLLLAG